MPLSPESQRPANFFPNCFVAPGLGQVSISGPLVDGVGHGGDFGISRQHHAHRVGIHAFDLRQKIRTGHAGHALIRNDQLHRILRQQGKPFIGIRGQQNVVAFPPQGPLERI
jgi:hypothetical protein